MEKMLLMFTLAVLCTAVVGLDCTGSYAAAATATSEGVNWSASWTVSADSQYVTFTVMARTDGWIAIGFSSNAMMPNTDIVVGAANDVGNESYVSDRYATDRVPPAVDASQDIMNSSARQMDMGGNIYTIVTFTRPIASSNADDLALDQDRYLLYAWGTERNFNGSDPMSIMPHAGGSPLARGPSTSPITILCPAPTEPPATAAPATDPPACSGSYTAAATSDGVNWSASWYVSADLQYVTFTVMARTTGWIAIGFSTNQMMMDTDIIVGAADDSGSDSYVSDRYATARAAPPVDASQDIMNANARQMDMGGNIYTIVTFTRPIASSNAFDLALDQDRYLLYAWGNENNFDGSDPTSILQHSSGTLARGPSTSPITILCAATSPTPTAGAAIPVATATILILALIAIMATLF